MKPLWKRILSGAAAVLAACSLFAAPVSAGWVQSGAKWWYKNADGSYPKSSWSQITDKWYRFDSSGWMLTGWQKVGKSWYYLGTDGAMKTGWLELDGKRYYLKSSGAMATGTATVDGKSYTFSASGVLEESAANRIVYWGETPPESGRGAFLSGRTLRRRVVSDHRPPHGEGTLPHLRRMGGSGADPPRPALSGTGRIPTAPCFQGRDALLRLQLRDGLFTETLPR